MDVVTLALANGYAKSYTDGKISELGTVFRLKGTKPTVADLPTTGNVKGDVWYVVADQVGYIWIEDETHTLRWEKLGDGYAIPVLYW